MLRVVAMLKGKPLSHLQFSGKLKQVFPGISLSLTLPDAVLVLDEVLLELMKGRVVKY